MSKDEPFGMVGVFASSQPMLEAARQLRSLGLETIDAYTPYPVEGIGEAMRLGRAAFLAWIIAAGALIGAGCGYFVYPINVGGRPYNSWPAFTVGAFETTLLFAVTAGFLGLWFACRLPRLYDPKLEVEAFDRASIDRFVLRVEANGTRTAREQVRRAFEDHGAEQIVEVVA
jgi:hypothetical protein